MAENDDYLEAIDNNHLDGTNGSLNMTDNSLGVSIHCINCFYIILYVQEIISFLLGMNTNSVLPQFSHLSRTNGNLPLPV